MSPTLVCCQLAEHKLFSSIFIFSLKIASSHPKKKMHHKLAHSFTTKRVKPVKIIDGCFNNHIPQKAAIMSWKFFFSSHNYPLFNVPLPPQIAVRSRAMLAFKLKLLCHQLNSPGGYASVFPAVKRRQFSEKVFPTYLPLPDSFSPKALYFLRKSCARNILRISIFFFHKISIVKIGGWKWEEGRRRCL